MQDETLSDGELGERQDFTGRHDRARESAEHDVLLDVPQLRVEEIILEVEDLRAHVSVQADVLNLLRLSIGADVQLGGVHLEIKGVEAQALLKVRLNKVAEIINRCWRRSTATPRSSAKLSPHSELRPESWKARQDMPSTKSPALWEVQPLTSTVPSRRRSESMTKAALQPRNRLVRTCRSMRPSPPDLTKDRSAARGADRSRSATPRSDLPEGLRRQRPRRRPRHRARRPVEAEHLRFQEVPRTGDPLERNPD